MTVTAERWPAPAATTTSLHHTTSPPLPLREGVGILAGSDQVLERQPLLCCFLSFPTASGQPIFGLVNRLRRRYVSGLFSYIVIAACTAQEVVDTALFEVRLSADSASLFYCDRNVPIRRILSGPAVMADGHLLLHSACGYALYDTTGTLLDSLVLRPESGRKGEPTEAPFLVCVLDSTTILLAVKTGKPEHPIAYYYKRLFKKRSRELKTDESAQYRPLLAGSVVNIARNTLTDVMAQRAYAAPNLVGFTSLGHAGERWWTLDRFYTHTSPLIHEQDTVCAGFFPGMDPGRRSIRDVAVDIVGTYAVDGRQRYVGVFAPMGGQAWETYQRVYVADHAGNVLAVDSILKQSNAEIMIGRDNDPVRPTFYYARATKNFVFPPSVDRRGRLVYGVVEYDQRRLTVRRRSYGAFVAEPCEAELAHMIDIERDISYEPLSLPCGLQQQAGAMIPLVRLTDSKGERRTADARDLTRGGFLIRITRTVYRDIQSKLARGRSGLPPRVEHMRDSLAALPTAGCPYSISLTGPKGVVGTLDYGVGETVLCARVIAVQSSGRVLVRVDLEDYAEALLFSPDGALVNRFVFNRQQCTLRNDILVAVGSSPIIELDYERDPAHGTYLRWDLRSP